MSFHRTHTKNVSPAQIEPFKPKITFQKNLEHKCPPVGLGQMVFFFARTQLTQPVAHHYQTLFFSVAPLAGGLPHRDIIFVTLLTLHYCHTLFVFGLLRFYFFYFIHTIHIFECAN